MQYNVIPCNTMQYHAIPYNTMSYYAIPCNIMQYHAIPCKTMQYHAKPYIFNNCWRSVPLPRGQYNGHFCNVGCCTISMSDRYLFWRVATRNFEVNKYLLKSSVLSDIPLPNARWALFQVVGTYWRHCQCTSSKLTTTQCFLTPQCWWSKVLLPTDLPAAAGWTTTPYQRGETSGVASMSSEGKLMMLWKVFRFLPLVQL